MSLQTLRTLLADKLGGNSPSTILSADQSTGQQPMTLGDIEEHTENYLAVENGEGKYRGGLTGALAGVGALLCAYLAVTDYLAGDIEGTIDSALFALALFFIPFLWEVMRPLPLPILFNRRTRELYFEQDRELYHSPWDCIAAAAYEFHMVGPYTGGMRNAALEVLVHRFNHPEEQMLLSLGLPIGKSLDLQESFWEYLRSYMNNGPWFDEQGNNSTSDAFAKSQLEVRYRAGQVLPFTWQQLQEERRAAGGKNYLDYSSAVMLVCATLLYPMGAIQEFTYNIAKRRARSRWPDVVTERLHEGGPITRLIDLEQEKV
ncbi:DUF6708 domain-containing protein [Atopomonas sediminilitoris]|uniref:DUF6708 domain-containing protein n=1 Tax=Atopomonas sediminilitoris TaxID=2919919 RepID=UPI001F4E1C78|nr:DUF6708 domain-containing protein [Atopomonas sediminilitoris]MCJ8170472.1 hypothetical protein [Atopomonas sediminilitoris]